MAVFVSTYYCTPVLYDLAGGESEVTDVSRCRSRPLWEDPSHSSQFIGPSRMTVSSFGYVVLSDAMHNTI